MEAVTPDDLARIRRRASYPLRPIHLSDIQTLLEEIARLQQLLREQGEKRA